MAHAIDFIIQNIPFDHRKDLVLRMINSHVIDPNIKNRKDENLLMYTQDYDIMEALLKNGANVNAADHDGFTPFLYLLFKTHDPLKYLKQIELLIKYGADIYIKNKHGLVMIDVLDYTQPGFKDIIIKMYNHYNSKRAFLLFHTPMAPDNIKVTRKYLFSGKKRVRGKSRKSNWL
jgi:ankyrin repeat protein